MPRIEDTLWCDGCGVEIFGAPVILKKKYYCCKDCANGLECNCGEKMEIDTGHTVGDATQNPYYREPNR
jgi:hypothetical protein